MAVGDTEVNALARAIERLVRAGFRVGMDQMTTARLLDAATFKDLRNEAEPEDAPESAPAPAPVIASRRAQELAEHYGLDLDDIPHTGSRVLLRDVQEYLNGLGVAV